MYKSIFSEYNLVFKVHCSYFVLFLFQELTEENSFVNILNVAADLPYYGGRSVKQNTYNGVQERGGETECYVSKTPKAGWIHYTISYSNVKTIYIFSIPGKFFLFCELNQPQISFQKVLWCCLC